MRTVGRAAALVLAALLLPANDIIWPGAKTEALKSS